MARVTLVVNNYDEGSETFLHGLAHQLVRIGHEVTVHALLDGRTAMRTGESFDSVGVRRSSALPAVRSSGFLPSAWRLVRRDARSVVRASRRALRAFGVSRRSAHAVAVAAPLLATRPEVVHVAFSGIGVAIGDALRLLDRDTRLIVSCRGSGELVAPHVDPELGPRLADLLGRADAVHVVASAVAEVVRGLGVPERSIHLVRPAIDTDQFRPPAVPRSRSGPLNIVTVARLHWVKGLEVQLAAAVELNGEGRDVRWTIVGDGPARAELEQMARLAGIGSRVVFAGALTPDRVRDLVVDSDVLVSSSWSEGTSNSALEAMALGVPVVSSAAGGMPEVLTDGVDALVFPIGDAHSLAEAIRLIDQDPLAAGSIADRARRTVEDHFTVERQQQDWTRVYDSVLAGRGRAA